MRNHTPAVSDRRGEQGFTLIEALIAMVILIVGIVAIANLMVVAGSSNTVANNTTAASAVATRQMDLLKSASYETLVPGGNALIPAGPHAAGHPVCDAAPVQGVFVCDANVLGVGLIHVQWAITTIPAAAPAATVFIDLRAQPVAPTIGLRGQAHYTTFRTSN